MPTPEQTAMRPRRTATTPAGAAPLRRQTMAELTLEAIRELILGGDYPEGSALRQDALAAELGVSRIPVREALRQLEVEGLVTLSPHVGAVVSTLSLAEIKELFELRTLIETELLRRAVPAVDDAALVRAEEILDRYQEALESDDIAAWGSLNWEFHSALYAPAQQPLTMGIVQNLQNQSDRYFRIQLAFTNGRGRANDEHRAILRAVRERDAPHACSLLNAHILGAGRSLLEFLRDHRKNPVAAAR
jgi:DNA-binding GntR family transcriptional regulator